MRKLKTEELDRISVAEFKELRKVPLVVVMDNIRSGLNVGSIFRTCDAFAIEHIHLCGITAKPPHREILKSALGATESVNWTYHETVNGCVSSLKEEGYRISGIEQTSRSIPLQQVPGLPASKWALVFGNEVEGLSEEVLPLLDEAIEIPQLGTKHSINVAVCAGVVIWHLLRENL